jgi:hypothetical protein
MIDPDDLRNHTEVGTGYTKDAMLCKAADEIARLRDLLLWSLYHHQGASSTIGQPIRKALGIGENDNLTYEQVTAAEIAAGVR